MKKIKIGKKGIIISIIFAYALFSWLYFSHWQNIFGSGKILGESRSGSETTSRDSGSTSDSSRTSSDSNSRTSSSSDDDNSREDDSESEKTKSCPSYCHDGTYYYGGDYSSRSNKCQYEEKKCDYGCNSSGSGCGSAPGTPVLASPERAASTGNNSGGTLSGTSGERENLETKEPEVLNPEEWLKNQPTGYAYDKYGRTITEIEDMTNIETPEKMTEDQASSLAARKYDSLGEIEKIETKTSEQENIYIFEAKRKARLFGIIPIEIGTEIEVDSKTGDVNLERRWWDFMVDWSDIDDNKPESCGNNICEKEEGSQICPEDCGALCGNGKCDATDKKICPEDCGVSKCGDGLCEDGETLDLCAPDCHKCGNGVCESGESYKTCALDCCGYCGDQKCAYYSDGQCAETSELCPKDCGPAVCGNDKCEPGENPQVCPNDCLQGGCGDGECRPTDGGPDVCPIDCANSCGDHLCQAPENWKNCLIDCGFCGDEICGNLETQENCKDCKARCGNGRCEGGESPEICKEDCKSICSGQDCIGLCGDGICTQADLKSGCEADCSINCGDGKCQGAETSKNCSSDCPLAKIQEKKFWLFGSQSYCGDGECKEEENSTNCIEDCQAICQDGACGKGEDYKNCPWDCVESCGDKMCNGLDSQKNCPKDCEPECGNGKCEKGEYQKTCPVDCGDLECGNDQCEQGETFWNYDASSNSYKSVVACFQDCQKKICGDGICWADENPENCAKDCGATCGNNICEGGENYSECPWDCGYCGDQVCSTKEKGKCDLDCLPACGDGICEASEKNACSADCSSSGENSSAVSENDETESGKTENKNINMPLVDGKGNTLNYRQGESESESKVSGEGIGIAVIGENIKISGSGKNFIFKNNFEDIKKRYRISQRAIEKVEVRIEKNEKNEEKPFYLFTLKTPVKLLWVFKLIREENVKVDAETGQEVAVERPWWSVIASDPKPEDLIPNFCQKQEDCKKYEDNDSCNGTLYCNLAASQCQTNPATIIDCPKVNSSDGCQANTCNPQNGKCEMKALAENTVCNDGNFCTLGDICQTGQCKSGTNTCQCQNDKDCAQHEDGNLCNGKLFCNKSNGKCEVNPATEVNCQSVDDSECQKNICNPQTGKCEMKAINFGNPCEVADSCIDSFCTIGGKCEGIWNFNKTNEDGSSCQCRNDSDCQNYEDGNLCNGTLFCNKSNGKCEVNSSTEINCQSVNDTDCQKNTCNPQNGKCEMEALTENTACDDANFCTVGDFCQAGKCQSGKNNCQCQNETDCEQHEDGNLCNGTLYCDKASGTCKLNAASLIYCPSADDTETMKNTCQPLMGECVMQEMIQ